MRLDLVKKPEGTWCSFNEFCGTGDAATKEFKTPIPAKEARAVIVLRNFDIAQSDGRIVTLNEKDGTILKDEPDGYKLETREEDLWVVFDRAPALGVRISTSGLGRQVGDAFKVLPMSTLLGKKIADGQPAIFRGSIKERERMTANDLQEAGRASFMLLVVDWSGITDGEDKPLACTSETRKLFLDNADAMFFGIFVTNRASAIRAERINSLEKDSSD